MFMYLGIVGDYPDGQKIAWSVERLKSSAPAIAIVDFVVAECDIVDITVPFAGEPGGAKSQHVLQGGDRQRAAET